MVLALQVCIPSPLTSLLALTTLVGSSGPATLSTFRLSGAAANSSGATPAASARYQDLANDMTGQFTGITVQGFLDHFLPEGNSGIPRHFRFPKGAKTSEEAWVSSFKQPLLANFRVLTLMIGTIDQLVALLPQPYFQGHQRRTNCHGWPKEPPRHHRIPNRRPRPRRGS